MAETLTSAKGFVTVIKSILNSAIAATGLERGAILLLDDAGKLEPAVCVGMEKDKAIISLSAVKRAVDAGEMTVICDAGADDALKEAQSIIAQNIKSTICMPLKSRSQKMLGVLYLDSRFSGVNRDNIDKDFLRMFSLFAASAIQTSQADQKERAMSEELAASRERDKYEKQLKALEEENKRLVEQAGRTQVQNILGSSEPMQKMYSFIEKVAATEVTVLITGDTGTGKTLIAKAIHELSDRKAREFVTIDCVSIPSELLESELFGYERGAFTGAVAQKKGRIEIANGGTLFLDEIGDMSVNLQAKLLRFLQEKSFERVGGNKTLSLNVRVIAATNKDLRQAVAQKVFREDLYYRLSAVTLHAPPLRERGEDIIILANTFLDEARRQNNIDIKGFTPEAKNVILHYSWEGNVRQLKNVIQRAAILCNSKHIGPADLGLEPASASPEGVTLKAAREEVDKKLIRQQLIAQKGNLSKTARCLGIDRSTLRELVKKYGIEGGEEE
jgi:two-component system NtrC family response regulator